MKNTFKKSSLLLLFVLAILFSSRAFGQFSSTAPGGSSTEYNNAPVGIQLGSPYTLTPSNVSLDLKNNLALRAGTIIFNSFYGSVDFGDGNIGGSDALYFRSLSTQGDYTTWTTRMLLSYTGNLGIGLGNTFPAERLDVSGTDGSGIVAIFRDGAGSYTNNHVFLGTGLSASSGFSSSVASGDNGIFWSDAFGTGTNTSSGFVIAPYKTSAYGIRIDPNGKVGIGTSSPAEVLDVSGADAGGEISVFRNGNSNVFLSANLAVNNDNPLTLANDNGIFWSDAGTGLNNSSGLVIAPHFGSAAGIRIAANGNVGVGMSSPITAMEVGGNLTVDGSFNNNIWTTANWRTPIILGELGAIRGPQTGTTHVYLGNGITDDGSNTGWYWIQSTANDNSQAANYPMSLTYSDASFSAATSIPTLNVNGVVNATGSTNALWTTVVGSPYPAATSNSNGGWTVPITIPNGGAIRTASTGSTSYSDGITGRYLGFGMVDNDQSSDVATTGWYWIIQGNKSSSTPACYPMTLLMDQAGNATITLSQNGWADYVFDTTYKKMTIEEKEKFYLQNKHLPGIDPTSVVSKKGLNVNKNLVGILQNVEEDRLDISSLYKLIEKQNAEIEELKSALKEMKNSK